MVFLSFLNFKDDCSGVLMVFSPNFTISKFLKHALNYDTCGELFSNLGTICLVKTIEVVYNVDIIKQYSHQMVLL